MTMVSYFPSLYNLTLVFECIKVTEYIFVQQIETSTVMVVVEKSWRINYRSINTFALFLSPLLCFQSYVGFLPLGSLFLILLEVRKLLV